MTYSDHKLLTLRNEKASAAYVAIHVNFTQATITCYSIPYFHLYKKESCTALLFDGGWNTVNSGY